MISAYEPDSRQSGRETVFRRCRIHLLSEESLRVPPLSRDIEFNLQRNTTCAHIRTFSSDAGEDTALAFIVVIR